MEAEFHIWIILFVNSLVKRISLHLLQDLFFFVVRVVEYLSNTENLFHSFGCGLSNLFLSL